MPEPTNNGTQGGQGDGSGDGNNNANKDQNQSIDLANLPPDQLEKVLENKNLWNLPRIKELRDSAAEAKKLKEAQDKANEDSLANQKKFEELANQRGEKVSTLEKQLQDMNVNQALTGKLVPAGVRDLEAALKLVDRSKITVDDNGDIKGLDEAFNSLKTDKPYLFSTEGDSQNTTVGNPSNGSNSNSSNGAPKKFKRSQLQNNAFYQEHRKEIVEAQAKGLIEDDISPR